MLVAKRGDIFIEWPHGAWPDIKRLGLSDKVVETSVRLSEMPFHMLIRKDSPHVNILAEFDNVINLGVLRSSAFYLRRKLPDADE